MGRVYTARFSGISVTAAQDLFEINAPSDAVVEILSAFFGQTSDFGDAQAEGLEIEWAKRPTSSGGAGAAVTPEPHETGDAAFGGTVERNNTTQATGGNVMGSEAFNVQAGFAYPPTPKEIVILSPSERFVFSLVGTPADAIVMTGRVTFVEIGG